MKYKKNTLILFLFAFFPVFCFAQESVPDSSNMVTLHINPTNAKGGLISDVFSEVEFIPLETTKESLFGRIDRLTIINNCFVFNDIDTRATYIFEKNGKFKAKILSRSIKKEWPVISFEMRKFNKEEAIFFDVGSEGFYFDTNGKLLKKIEQHELRKTYFSSHKAYVEVGNLNKNDSLTYDLQILTSNSEIGKYFPRKEGKWDNDDPIGGDDIYDFGGIDKFLFLRIHDYHIYLATPKKLFTAYKFVFPFGKTIPTDFMTNERYRNKKREWIKKNPQAIYGIEQGFLMGDNLFFKTNQHAGRDQKNDLIYNLKTRELKSTVDLEPNSLSQFLPITDFATGFNFKNNGFLCYNNGSLYTTYSALEAFNYKGQSSSKNANYDPRLTKFFEEGSIKDNPIIVRLKPKVN